MAILPATSASGGLTNTSTTNAQQRTNFGNLRDFLADYLGDDSSSAAAPRSRLGIDRPSISCSVGSGALTIALKSAVGADPSASVPVPVPFRSATASSGSRALRAATAATSLVISSGSTLGHSSGVASPIYVYALDTGTSVELAATTTYQGQSFIGSTTAEGGAGAADSATAIYSTTARTGVAMQLLAMLTSTQTTAGTWAAVPTAVALADLASAIESIYTTQGDLLTRNSSGKLERLARGSDGQVLSAKASASGGLEWATIASVPRKHIDGLEISGSTGTSLTIAAGACADGTDAVMMTSSADVTKTTGAWAVGSGNGGLDEGTIAATLCYHVYQIYRSDTQVVDKLISLSHDRQATVTMTIASPCVVTWPGHGLMPGAGVVFSTSGSLPTGITAGVRYYVIGTGITDDTFRISATQGGAAINTSGSQSGVHTCRAEPKMPTGYTHRRLIGSRWTNGSSQFRGTLQWGDDVRYIDPILDISTAAAFSSATLRYLTVPSGYSVEALLNVAYTADAGPIYHSHPSQTDGVPSSSSAPLASMGTYSGPQSVIAQTSVRTGTQRQYRSRQGSGASTTNYNVATIGWRVDRRLL